MRYLDNYTLFWLLIALIFFLPGLGGVHLFDWDEINFAELAREMLLSGEYLQPQMNFQAFTEKPPLFFWLQALSMGILGVGEYAARFPNALLGIIAMPVLYINGKFLLDRRFGYLWALSWLGSVLPFLYYKSGIIDPWFNFLIFFALFFIIHYVWKRQKQRDLYLMRSRRTYIWLAAIFSGLAVLTKGPVALLLIWLPTGLYYLISRFQPLISLKSLLKYSLITLLVIGSWFGLDYMLNGPDFIVEFTIRQWELLSSSDAGHKGFPAYHLVVLLIGCFPASIFAMYAYGRWNAMPAHLLDFRKWMLILLIVVVVLFSLVGTKIIHYSSMAYYPITFLSAMGLYKISEKNLPLIKSLKVLLILIFAIFLGASLAFPYMGMHLDDFRHLFARDPFASANLQASVNWGIVDYIPAIWLLLLGLTVVFLWRKYPRPAIRLLFLGNAIWVMAALYFFIGKVEHISQRAAIEFFEQQSGEEVYVTTYKYKSYAPWFYAKVQPYSHPQARDQQWLLSGAVDRPVYLSARIMQKEDLQQSVPDAEFLYEKNGFVFFRRPAVAASR